MIDALLHIFVLLGRLVGMCLVLGVWLFILYAINSEANTLFKEYHNRKK